MQIKIIKEVEQFGLDGIKVVKLSVGDMLTVDTNISKRDADIILSNKIGVLHSEKPTDNIIEKSVKTKRVSK